MKMEMLVRVINELHENFIKAQIKKAILAVENESNTKTENDLEDACMTLIIKKKIKERGVSNLIQDLSRIDNLHSFFKNSHN